MIRPVKDFVLKFSQEHPNIKNVLEVGSLDVNGNVRNFFGCAYTGIDLKEGANVEIAMDAMDIKKRFKKGEFDLVMCLETLEHVKDPVAIVNNMKWALQKGGWMLITTPGTAHTEHFWPSDYYRFFENTYKDVFFKGFKDCEIKTMIWDAAGIVSPNDKFPCAILGYGRKGGGK